MSKLPTRQPDHTSKYGNEYWFDEMICKIGSRFATMKVTDDDKLCIWSGRTKVFDNIIQIAYKEWRVKQVEKLLLTQENELETKTQTS